jgi:hypothetical protein
MYAKDVPRRVPRRWCGNAAGSAGGHAGARREILDALRTSSVPLVQTLRPIPYLLRSDAYGRFVADPD